MENVNCRDCLQENRTYTPFVSETLMIATYRKQFREEARFRNRENEESAIDVKPK